MLQMPVAWDGNSRTSNSCPTNEFNGKEAPLKTWGELIRDAARVVGWTQYTSTLPPLSFRILIPRVVCLFVTGALPPLLITTQDDKKHSNNREEAAMVTICCHMYLWYLLECSSRSSHNDRCHVQYCTKSFWNHATNGQRPTTRSTVCGFSASILYVDAGLAWHACSMYQKTQLELWIRTRTLSSRVFIELLLCWERCLYLAPGVNIWKIRKRLCISRYSRNNQFFPETRETISSFARFAKQSTDVQTLSGHSSGIDRNTLELDACIP